MNLRLNSRFALRLTSPLREGRSAPVPGRSDCHGESRLQILERCDRIFPLLRPGTVALLALAFLLSGLPLPAQDTNGAPQFNDVFDEEVGLPQTNDVVEPDSAGQIHVAGNVRVSGHDLGYNLARAGRCFSLGACGASSETQAENQ